MHMLITAVGRLPTIVHLPHTRAGGGLARARWPSPAPDRHLIESDAVHPHIQKALNLLGRLEAAQASPDLVDQIYADARTGEPAMFPHHGPGNVRPVPQTVSLGKGGGHVHCNNLTMPCILENNQINDEGNEIEPVSMDGAAASFNTLALLEYASLNWHMLDHDLNERRQGIPIGSITATTPTGGRALCHQPTSTHSKRRTVRRLLRLITWLHSCAPTRHIGMTSRSRTAMASRPCYLLQTRPRRSLRHCWM